MHKITQKVPYDGNTVLFPKSSLRLGKTLSGSDSLRPAIVFVTNGNAIYCEFLVVDMNEDNLGRYGYIEFHEKDFSVDLMGRIAALHTKEYRTPVPINLSDIFDILVPSPSFPECEEDIAYATMEWVTVQVAKYFSIQVGLKEVRTHNGTAVSAHVVLTHKPSNIKKSFKVTTEEYRDIISAQSSLN